MISGAKALLVDNDIGAKTLLEPLLKSFGLGEIELAQNFNETLQSHLSNDFEFCFISDVFPSDAVKIFFSDYQKMEKDFPCVFVQLRDTVGANVDRSSLRDFGFTSIISRSVNDSDLRALEAALRERGDIKEIQTKVGNVDLALKKVLKDIDECASEKRRGKEVTLHSIAVDFIGKEASFNDTVHSKYINKLARETSASKPQATVLTIPDDVLSKNAPGLTREAYTGASKRVWKRLLKRFGI